MPGINLSRRTLLAGMAAMPLLRAAEAQTAWPTKPVRVMVPYPPAGGADTTGRIVFGTLGQLFNQQFVVENRGGAGGTIGEAVVAKAEPDGYTVLHDATAFSVNSSLYSNLPFDYNKDFDPVALVSLVPNILVVTPSLPVKTVADVIAYAKATPDGIDMASSGNGTLQHLSLEMFRHQTGIKISHVPYRGGGLALNDVMAGQVKFFFSNGSSVVGLIQGGKVKAIAHTGKGRLKSFRIFRLFPTLCLALKRMNGTGCLCRTALPRRSCRSSTPASTTCCMIPTSPRVFSSSILTYARQLRRNSVVLCRIKWRFGAKW